MFTAEMIAADASDDIIDLVTSPDLITRPPALRHPGLLAPSCAGLAYLWQRGAVVLRQVRLLRLREVFVIGEGLVFDAKYRLVAESRNEYEDADIAAFRAALRAAVLGGAIAGVAEPSLLLKKCGARNYGHWMVEMLPKAFLAAGRLGPAALRYVAPAVDGPMARVIAQSLAMAGIPQDSILAVPDAQPVFFQELILVDGLTRHGDFISPLVMDCLDHLAGQVAADPPALLYASRRGARYRCFADEAEVVGLLAAAGVRVVDPGHMPLAAQIAAFKGARGAMGVMGAALTNIAFAPAGIPVVSFAPSDMPDIFFWLLSCLRGQEYQEIRCAQAPARRGAASWDADLLLGDGDLDFALRALRA